MTSIGDVRAVLRPYRERRTATALALLAVDAAAYAACVAGIVLAPHPAVKVALGVVAGIVIGRLFVLGHDACHGSFTPHRRLNDLIARLAFLPSLTPLGPWRLGHNETHHAYTNRRGLDYVWAPFSPQEWAGLAPHRRALERVYRSALGQGANYLIEIWWKYLLFPRRDTQRRWRRGYVHDTALVASAAVLVLAAMVWAARATHQSPLELVAVAMALPFAVWNALMGFVIYQHHTDPDIHWYAATERAPQSLQLDATQHVVFPGPVNRLFHNIMEHTAHHADPLIPLYNVVSAQRALQAAIPNAGAPKQWTLRGFLDVTRRCKLYDFEARCWTDFRGRPTSARRSAADVTIRSREAVALARGND